MNQLAEMKTWELDELYAAWQTEKKLYRGTFSCQAEMNFG